MSDSTKRYVIRQPGYASWAEADTIDEAFALRREAQQRLGNVYVLVYDTVLDRDITQDHSD